MEMQIQRNALARINVRRGSEILKEVLIKNVSVKKKKKNRYDFVAKRHTKKNYYLQRSVQNVDFVIGLRNTRVITQL